MNDFYARKFEIIGFHVKTLVTGDSTRRKTVVDDK